MVQDIGAIEPELLTTGEQAEESANALQAAEQAMQDWREEWEDFNRRSAERSQSVQVERTRLDHLQRQMQQLDDRLLRMGQEQQNLDSNAPSDEVNRLIRTASEEEELAAAKQSLLMAAGQRINEIRSGIDLREQETVALQSTHHDLRGQLASLETLQQAALGQRSSAVSGWLDAQGLADAPRLAQEIEVESGWEHAVETALGQYLEAVCVDGFENAEQMLGGFEQGAVALFNRGADVSAAPGNGAFTRLTDKIHSALPIGALLDGIYTADSLPEALTMVASLSAGESVVTRDGIWLGQGWLRVARDTDEKAGVLQREREIGQLQEEIAGQAEQLESLRRDTATARDELVAAEQERDQLQTGYNEVHRRAGELQAELSACRSRLEQHRNRSEDVSRETEELRVQKTREEEEYSTARSRLDEALAGIETLTAEREERTRRQQALTTELDAARERSRSAQQAMHELALRAESLRTARDATDEGLERMREQRRQLASRRDELSGILSHGDTPIVELESQLGQLLTQRAEVESRLGAARKHVEDIEHTVREQDQDRIRRERAVTGQRQQVEHDRMAWQEVKVRSDTLLEQINECGFDYEKLLEELDEGATAEAWAEQAETLEKRIQRLGPINLAAIDEFEEESERKVYLDAQHADLTEALDTLETAIAKIDRETRERFRETFDVVNKGFQERFPRLFGGGQAYLELTGEDLLDTGVTVMARPPGKRNSTIHLLSGGEKALTAIAMVFSIFELNPSPFCMLDEVDAPLDDANVGRYCDMVREMSERVQFIFITHNKVTMEMANQLTGVTMNEPGVSRLVAVDVDAAVEMAAM
jgi:chromosome segregation protein